MSREIIVPGRYDRIYEVCQFVVNGARQAGFEEDDLFKIELACDEACTNVIEHAYGGEDKGSLQVTWGIHGRSFAIMIRDTGDKFSPGSVPEPNIPSDSDSLNDLQIGGLGIHFMRNLMDEVHFTYSDQNGNLLIMVKYIPSDAKQ